MKIILTTTFLFLGILNVLFSQKFEIKGDTAYCIGDTIELIPFVSDEVEILNQNWIIDSIIYYPLDNKLSSLDLKEDVNGNITVKVLFEYINRQDTSTENKYYAAQIEITINKIFISDFQVDSFLKNNDLYLKVNNEGNFSYEWESPSGEKKSGYIANFTRENENDPETYKLTIVDNITGCKGTIDYLYYPFDEYENREDGSTNPAIIKRDTTPKEKNVFGSLNDNEIPDNLYKEVKRDIPIYESTITGEILSESFLIALPGYRFTIIGQTEDDYIIRFQLFDKKFLRGSNRNDTIYTYESKLDDKYKIFYSVENNKATGFLFDIKGIAIADIELWEEYGKTTTTNKNGFFSLQLSTQKAQINIRKPDKTKAVVSGRTSSEKKDFKVNSIDAIAYLNNKYVFKNKYNENEIKDYRYFRVSKNDVAARTISFVPNGISFTAGTILVPIKTRSSKDNNGNTNNFEFSKDIAIGPFVGGKLRIDNYRPNFFNLGLSVGISSVSIVNKSTDNITSFPVQDIAAFTWSVGGIFEFDKIQVGIFAGKDRINNNFNVDERTGYNWQYQNKLWWSIGFGYSLIDRPNKNLNNQEKSMNKQ
jgi:hypothetical protein